MPFKDKEKQREYQRQWMANRRNVWLLQNGPCIDCSKWDNLEVDHIDQTTKVDHKVWSWSKIRRDAELAKCCVRCYDCHKLKTVRDNSGENDPASKLTWEAVNEIRSTQGQTKYLAIKYGVSDRAIRYVRSETTWKRG